MKWSATAAVVTACAALSMTHHASAASQERWLVAKATDGSLAYEIGSLAPNPETGYITLATGLYLSTPDSRTAGMTFQYILSEDRINCADNTYQALARVFLDGNQDMVDHIELDAQPWQPISSNPLLTFLQSVACNGDAVDDTREAASIEEALNLLKTMAD